MAEHWMLLKRGLFYRPNNCGYTGIRDEAGRYSKEDADNHLAAGGVAMREADAPEFLPAAFDDLVVKHLTAQRDALVKALTEIDTLAVCTGVVDPALHYKMLCNIARIARAALLLSGDPVGSVRSSGK